MRYKLNCTSTWDSEKLLKKYPVLNKYNPIVDYPYPNPKAERVTIEVSDLIKFYDEIGEEIIIGKDYGDGELYSLEIYDDYRE